MNDHLLDRNFAPMKAPVTLKPCRKRSHTRRVTISEEEPSENRYSNFDEQMSENERADMVQRLWYSRDDFDQFLKERVETLRQLDECGGDVQALPPQYCLRGFEPFQSADINHLINSKRQVAQQMIFSEQSRQRRLGIYDPSMLAMLVSNISQWSLTRAQELAAMDEYEVRPIQRRRSSTVQRRTSAIGSMMPRKRSQVDVAKLKQMNAQLLRKMFKANQSVPGRFNIRRDSLLGLTMAASERGCLEAATRATPYPFQPRCQTSVDPKGTHATSALGLLSLAAQRRDSLSSMQRG